MSIYIPFNFRPVEIKSVGNAVMPGLDSDAGTYSPPTGRYARVFAKGGIIAFGANPVFRDEAFGVQRGLTHPTFPAPNGPNSYTFDMGEGYNLITTFQLNNFPFDNFGFTPYNDVVGGSSGPIIPPGQPVSVPGSPVGGFRQSPWFYTNGIAPQGITYRNPHGVQLNVNIQWYFIPIMVHDFWMNENQTIRILGTKAQVTEYVNI